MKPLVYLHEQQVRDLNYSTDSIASLEGYARSKDGDTVLHTFRNLTKPNGSVVPSFFITSNSNRLFEQTEEQVDRLADSLKRKTILFVFLVNGNGQLKSKAILKKHNDLIECDVRFVPEKSALYSRSKGLLETDKLAKKTVGIVGLGSGGSTIAVELAKAGVSNFVLIDFDRLELANIARHVCGIDDLGRLKTLAVRDAIMQKNPYATIETLEIDITQQQNECVAALSQVDLIIGASDNDRSRFLINELSLAHHIPAIFGRALTRAIGGDVMRVRPYEGPCYNCLYSQNIRKSGGDDEEISQEKQAEKLLPDYTSAEDLNASIQVGLASDIAPISNLMVKLALVELSKGLETGITSLEEDLLADFYIWANRRENVYENWSKLEFNFDKPSILRWYGAKVARDPNCMVCGKLAV